MKRAIFLYNPQSGRGKAGAPAERVCDVFRECGYEIRAQQINFEDNPFDGNEDIDLMVVAGGDGTINYAINKMKIKGLDIPLGVIPSGTANDFAGTLGMSRSPLEAARQIAHGAVERVDCGRVNDIYYVNVCSFGLFTTTSQRTSNGQKHRIGKLAYLLEGAHEIVSVHGLPLRVTADGESFEMDALMVLIFNGGTAGGFRLARKASIRDGLLDCILLERKSFLFSVSSMLHYLFGGSPRAVKHLSARVIDIASAVDEPTDVDGQPGADFPLHVECMPGALQVVCPAKK